jgi:predicted  nucleic acid-binding Zn-ribbon protein
MSRANNALIVMCFAAFGLWGCTQSPSGGTAERIRALEAKCSKLEDDFKSVAEARDAAKKKITAIEKERDQIKQELDQQVTSRTAERDAAQAQFEQFRKNIRTLLGQADAAATGTPASMPAVSTVEAIDPNKS